MSREEKKKEKSVSVGGREEMNLGVNTFCLFFSLSAGESVHTDASPRPVLVSFRLNCLLVNTAGNLI